MRKGTRSTRAKVLVLPLTTEDVTLLTQRLRKGHGHLDMKAEAQRKACRGRKGNEEE